MVGDQKLGRYCKIPYHISDEDDGGGGGGGGGGRDKIGLSFFLSASRQTDRPSRPFFDGRICSSATGLLYEKKRYIASPIPILFCIG